MLNLPFVHLFLEKKSSETQAAMLEIALSVFKISKHKHLQLVKQRHWDKSTEREIK